MNLRFCDDRLLRLECDPTYRDGRFGDNVVRSFRKKIQVLRQATDERDLHNLKSLHFEKLKGRRAHQHSIRLNKQWRLILEFETNECGKVVVVISIEDYH